MSHWNIDSVVDIVIAAGKWTLGLLMAFAWVGCILIAITDAGPLSYRILTALAPLPCSVILAAGLWWDNVLHGPNGVFPPECDS